MIHCANVNRSIPNVAACCARALNGAPLVFGLRLLPLGTKEDISTPGLHHKILHHKIFARVWVAQEPICS